VILDYQTFVRTPFKIEAVEVTEENITQIAEMLGSKIYEDNRTGNTFIGVDNEQMPGIYRIYAGFWVTRMGHRFRAYSQQRFLKEFVKLTDGVAGWVKMAEGEVERSLASVTQEKQGM
jgi:hypothetical protein